MLISLKFCTFLILLHPHRPRPRPLLLHRPHLHPLRRRIPLRLMLLIVSAFS